MQDSEKLDLILKMVHTIDEKVSDLDAKVDNLETKVDNLETKVDNLETKVDNLETKVDDLDDRVERLESETREIRQKVTKMDLIMENELRVNIQRVAEGHLDLSRNLHEAMKPNNEIEMLAIKVRMLETDVRELKDKVS
jgi:outer membrane murein-binding lipoprotein Lpp